MILESEFEEKIVREVGITGNGAHVFVPKEWMGEKVVLIRIPKQSLKKKIISVLEPYLDKIAGVYLAGSHARNEAEKDSDIDLLVVSSEKIFIKKEGFEIICLKRDKISGAIKISPVFVYSLIYEAKPIINKELLEELKTEHRPKITDFTEYLKETERIIKINKELLESERGEFLEEDAIIYSLILRLRGIFFIKCLIKKINYTKKLFEKWVLSKVENIDYEKIYRAYNNSKRNLKTREKVRVKDLKLILELLKKETKALKK
ncbi:nucleotidyltransferase domain-containing protein [Candidatus Pacearchaeota archaeon]|nr:nucleotidyltransferase domain-containing protein [Candidatus Pacearchaeota archaeon]